MPMLAKFSDKIVGGTKYIEGDQKNPLRWTLYKLEEDTLVPQTHQFRCKDYFNDIVGWYQGKHVMVYGMNTSTMSFNDFGVFVKLSNTTPEFLDNFNTIIAPLLKKDLDVELLFVPLETAGEVLTLFPTSLFQNTFLISKLTLFIRCCNRDRKFTSQQDMLIQNIDWEEVCGGNYRKALEDETLLPPEKTRKYWYYAHPNVNSDHPESFYSSTLHDNGVVAWWNAAQRVR